MKRWLLLVACLMPVLVAGQLPPPQGPPEDRPPEQVTPHEQGPPEDRPPTHEAQTSMQYQVVRRVQRELQKQGYDPGTIDGKMGARTRSTLKRYQTDHGLPATGEIDAKTLETIELRTRQ